MNEEIIVQNPIRIHIHRFYPPMKQGEDEKWTTFHKTMLSAKGVNATEINTTIVNKTTLILEGEKTLQEMLEDIDEDKRDSYKKLIKIGARTGWAYKTIKEFMLAESENREPVLSPFPTF
jgi:hypothetical protein